MNTNQIMAAAGWTVLPTEVLQCFNLVVDMENPVRVMLTTCPPHFVAVVGVIKRHIKGKAIWEKSKVNFAIPAYAWCSGG